MERLNLKNLKVLTAAATLAMFAGTACADTEMYGQVNRTMTHVEDGQDSYTLFTDNEHSASRLGVKSHMHLNSCTTFGGVTEVTFNANNSDDVNQIVHTPDQTAVSNPSQVEIRKVDAYMTNKDWGTVSLGRGDAATNGVTELSYSGMGDTVLSSRVKDYAGGIFFHNAASNVSVNPVVTTPTVAQAFDNNDGAGRQHDRVRYDSPEWKGFTVGISHGHDTGRAVTALATPAVAAAAATTQRSFSDVAVNWEGDYTGWMTKAALGYAKWTKATNATTVATAENERILALSFAVEHKSTGFNGAIAYSKKKHVVNTTNSDARMFYLQAGKHFDWVSYGMTNVGADYFKGDSAILNSDSSSAWGLAVTQGFDKANTELYAGVRNYSYKLSNSVTTYDNVKALMIGVKFKFGAML